MPTKVSNPYFLRALLFSISGVAFIHFSFEEGIGVLLQWMGLVFLLNALGDFVRFISTAGKSVIVLTDDTIEINSSLHRVHISLNRITEVRRNILGYQLIISDGSKHQIQDSCFLSKGPQRRFIEELNTALSNTANRVPDTD